MCLSLLDPKLLSLFNFLLDFRFYSPIAIIYFTKVSGSFALGMGVFFGGFYGDSSA